MLLAKMKKLVLLLAVVLSQAAFATQQIPSGAQFDIGFSPKMNALETVLKGIEGAKQQILVASYSFTSKPIAVALLNAQKRGVRVFVVADRKENTKQYSAAQFLANQGVQVKLNGNYPIHHHKFMVIDGQHVELGSFNYSAAAADKNAENVLLLWNVKPIADTYSHEWKRLWDESEILGKAY